MGALVSSGCCSSCIRHFVPYFSRMNEEASSKDQSLRLFFPVISEQGRLSVQLTTKLAILGKDKKTGLTAD